MGTIKALSSFRMGYNILICYFVWYLPNNKNAVLAEYNTKSLPLKIPRRIEKNRYLQFFTNKEGTAATLNLTAFTLTFGFPSSTKTNKNINNLTSEDLSFLTSYTEQYLEDVYHRKYLNSFDSSVNLTNIILSPLETSSFALSYVGVANFSATQPFPQLTTDSLEYVTMQAFQGSSKAFYLDGINNHASDSPDNVLAHINSVNYSIFSTTPTSTNQKGTESTTPTSTNQKDTAGFDTSGNDSKVSGENQTSGANATDSNQKSAENSTGIKTGVIVASVMGGVALLVVALGGIILKRRLRQKHDHASGEISDRVVPSEQVIPTDEANDPNSKSLRVVPSYQEYSGNHSFDIEGGGLNNISFQGASVDNDEESTSKNNMVDTTILLSSPKRKYFTELSKSIGKKLPKKKKKTKVLKLGNEEHFQNFESPNASYAYEPSDSSFMDQSGASSIAPPSILVSSIGGEDRQTSGDIGLDMDNASITEMSLMDEDRFQRVLQIQAVDDSTGNSFVLPSNQYGVEVGAIENPFENYWDEKSTGFSLGYSVDGDCNTIQSTAGDSLIPKSDHDLLHDKKELSTLAEANLPSDAKTPRHSNLQKKNSDLFTSNNLFLPTIQDTEVVTSTETISTVGQSLLPRADRKSSINDQDVNKNVNRSTAGDSLVNNELPLEEKKGRWKSKREVATEEDAASI